MIDSLLLLSIYLFVFISTNLDDLFVLMAFFAKKDFIKVDVVIGQFLGMLSLILISSLAYFFQFLLPNYLLGLLGILPIIIGVKNLIGVYKDSKSDPVKGDDLNLPEERLPFLQVALVTFANGGDNIGVYAPIFAGLSLTGLTQLIIIFMIMTGLWCILSLKMIENRIIGGKVKKYGHIIFPFVLIVIGIFVIINGFM